MTRGRPKKDEITLSEVELNELKAIASSRSLAHGLVRRVKIILDSAQGDTNSVIAKRYDLSVPTVGHWRRRFMEYGLVGLYGETRPGRPRIYDDDEVMNLLQKVLQEKPSNSTHWSMRTLAKETGIPKSVVHRYCELFGVQPHRSKSFKLSTDPYFAEKVRDIVGLYLNPPDKALVLCVDEKSQIQALARSQPALLIGFGYVEGVTHDYFRHGTTTLFAALDIATSSVLTECTPRHRHQEFLSFLNHIEENVPTNMAVHMIIDNYCTHRHAKVKQWLAKHKRFHVHYTPTCASWLNQVERWFALISQQAIRRGLFRSTKELVRRIDEYVEKYNKDSRPFIWTATADSILKKIKRLCKYFNGTLHSYD
jgi:putative transposase